MKYRELKAELRRDKCLGETPHWMTTPGWQVIRPNIKTEWCSSVRERYGQIAKAASRHSPDPDKYYDIFFQMLWKNWLVPSTPVEVSMGGPLGCPVSCSGQYVGDSIHSFYSNAMESALLTKQGFGTSAYLGDIRPAGSSISKSTHRATGTLPVFKQLIQVSNDVAQSVRRGATACYLPIDHDDFYSWVDHVHHEPNGANPGWCISNEFISRLDKGDEDALERFQAALKLKMIQGKGYFFFTDRANQDRHDVWKDLGLDIKASNLCVEIALPANDDYSFTCVLSSINIARYEEWKDTNLIADATTFLDCVASEFIRIGKDIPGLEKAVRFTEDFRALGLGALGLSTYYQQQDWEFDSFEARRFNSVIFKRMHDEAKKESVRLHEHFGPSGLMGKYGTRHATNIAVAPNLSSAVKSGGFSQGIEPVYANVYMQLTQEGDVMRINPVFLGLMRDRGKYKKEVIDSVLSDNGSVKNQDWLSEHEKAVLRTAFEVRQDSIIEMASARQRFIDQGQSINLFFASDESEEEIARVHKLAFKDDRIKGLYYIRSETGIKKSNLNKQEECIACQ